MSRFSFFAQVTFIVPSDDGLYKVKRVNKQFSCLDDVAKYISEIDYPPHKIFISLNFDYDEQTKLFRREI